MHNNKAPAIRIRHLIVFLCMLMNLPVYLAAQYSVTRSVLDMSGGESSSGSYRLTGACGQTAAAVSSSAGYLLRGGFLAFGLSAVGIDRPEGKEQLPVTYALSQNYPNPFNPSTTIRLDIPEEAEEDVHVRLDIFDMRGRRLRTLIDEDREPGVYIVHWDGRTGQGGFAGSGVYLYRVSAGSFTATKKMMIVR